MEQFVDNREAPRKLCLLSVSWSDKDSIISDSIRNISETGVYIETTEKFSIGQEVAMRVLAPSKFPSDKHFNGIVVRIDDDGIGVKFTRETETQIETIKTIVDNI